MATLTLTSGLIGGLVATVAMTAFMMTLGDDSPPPTAVFWAKYVGDGAPDDYMMQGMVLHVLYGVVAGVAFVLAVPLLGLSIGSMATAILFGLAYGVVLFLGAATFWIRVVLGIEPDGPAMIGMFLFFHLVYGAVLGAWVQSGLF